MLKNWAEVAEQALVATSRVWAGRVAVPVIPVYVCERAEDLYELERAYNLACAEDLPRPAMNGAFYRDVPMIAVVACPERSVPGRLAHEVGHWSVALVTSSCPRVIDEGLAEYTEDVTFGGRPELRSMIEERRVERGDRLIGMSSRRRLRSMFIMTYREFQERPYNFEAAGCLADVLCRLEATDPGRLGRLLISYRESPSADPWSVFCSNYDPATIEKLWWAEIEADMK